MIDCLDDKVLVKQLVKGDIVSFDKLFEKYAEKLYTFSLRYLRSKLEAEEIVQDVFLKVWERRKELKSDRSFKSFIFTIAHNNILKYFRSKAYHQSLIQEQMLTSPESINEEESIEYRSVLEQVEQLVNLLPEKRKTIFIKSRIDGLSSKEIAKQMNIAPGTVDNNVSEALKFLRTNMEKISFGAVLYFYLFL